MRPHYKDQPVLMFREIIAVYSQNHSKPIYYVVKIQSFKVVRQVVHIITIFIYDNFNTIIIYNYPV
jgi:hypothetical protein